MDELTPACDSPETADAVVLGHSGALTICFAAALAFRNEILPGNWVDTAPAFAGGGTAWPPETPVSSAGHRQIADPRFAAPKILASACRFLDRDDGPVAPLGSGGYACGHAGSGTNQTNLHGVLHFPVDVSSFLNCFDDVKPCPNDLGGTTSQDVCQGPHRPTTCFCDPLDHGDRSLRCKAQTERRFENQPKCNSQPSFGTRVAKQRYAGSQ
eukprot:CAMPEP_0177720268 /NCGR_PEP_ID=MMETSP0484_2-20121128/16538_2 /TAXON_ID=354590 /ORGANISM="Rhodomonas lens, Strain RHODO" /LENGTH=211 /DNA_ID=CAMNT_0019232525 /DNA_START=363 /DNA_END=1000 /DNA_ORIENTATION=-